MKQRFILRKRNEDARLEGPLTEYFKTMHVRIIDKGPKSMLVESTHNLVKKWPENLNEDWMVFAEHHYQIPDSQKKIKPSKTPTKKSGLLPDD